MRIPNSTGRAGENIAAKYLEEKGYKIIDRNFRTSYKELDIVAIYKNTLVFIEVKTRSTELFGGAAESISANKLKSLVNASEFYKMTHPKLPDSLRIDAILIDLFSKKVKSIKHIENVSGFWEVLLDLEVL